MIVYPQGVGDTLAMAEWHCEIINEPLEVFGFNRNGEPLFQCMGFSRNNELVCVIVAYHASTSNIMLSIAATTPRWASKENLAAVGQWIYGQLGMQHISTVCLKSNKRSRKFTEGVGFRYEGKIRRGGNGEDMIIYGMLKEEHEEWLRKAFNVKERRNESRSS
jgi:hypothetical protein